MKKCIFLILLLSWLITSNANAIEADNNILKFRKSEAEHQAASTAVCISANSSGDIAIGFDGFTDDYINVYDENGNFKYCFLFNVDGSYFFEFDNSDNIMLFTVRGDTQYYFNTDAELLKTTKISDPVKSSRYYLEHSDKKSVNANGVRYVLKQSFGYTRLIKTDINGNETVIYEIGSYYLGKLLFGMLIMAFVLIAIFTIVKTTKKEFKKQNKP